MAIWTIYNQAGSTVRATVKELEYHGEWMGDEYVSVTVRSAEPVQFSVGDKLEYRGETFEINYDPNLIKRARSKSYGEAFVYENVRLYSQASRLKDVGFKDYVLNWNSQSNTIPYSSQGTFQFFCGSVEDLADRIQANLDRHTNGLWKVFTPNSVRTGQRHNCGSLWSSYYDGTEDTGKTDVNIEADNLSCLDAVNLSYSAFSLSYYVTNATVSGSVKNIIVIGGAPVSAAHNFRYGKDNGLYEIERTSDDSERIVTKLFAYGSDKNLPLNYYANLGKEIHISIYHKSTREIILGQPDLLLWVNKEWTRSLGSAFAPNYSVTLTSGSLTYKVSVTHDHLNGYDNDRGPLVEDVDYMYFRLWSGDAGAQAFYDAVTAGQTFTVTGVSINKMPEEWIYQPPSYNYPALLSISRLMLPGFPGTSLYSWVASHGGTNLNPTTGRATWRGHTAIFSRDARDPWVMSERSAILGVREGTLNFDGSAGEDEVAPTIEGAVDGAGRRLDEVAWAEQMDDSGFLGEDPEEGLLTFGFMPGGDPDYIDWLDNDGDVTISMKDGACVGREFKMKKAEKNGNGDWELTLNRCYDDSLGRYFPYREEGSNTLFQVVGSGNTHGTMEGNHFVILGISMPGGLVEAASIRLLEKALEQLDKKDHQTFTYIPKIDEIYMQRQDDAVKEGRDAATYGTVSMHDTLHAGMQMEIQDTDLDLHYMPFIDVLTIRENGNNGIPTYDVVLRDEKELTMQQRIQSQIEGGTEAAINGVEDAYSSSRYLSKIQDDTAQGFIRFIKGLQVGERFVPGLMGEGGVFRKEADGTTYIEADNLYIRMKAYFDTVEIRKFLHTGGNRIATVAGAKCVRVEWLDSSNNVLVQEQSNLSRVVKFRCFFRANDGDNIVTNDFLVGDQAYCHVTRMQSETMEQASEGTGGSMLTTRHYWRLVIGTNVSDDGGRLTEDGEYWIDLSNYFYNGQTANMTWEAEGVTHNHLSHQAGSDIPMAQDDIVQLGHAYDTTRQGAIVEFVTGGDSPSYQIFQGIDEFSFVGKNYISLGYATGSTNTHGAGHAYMDLYGDVFIGAKPDAVTGESPTYIKYDSENQELTIKAIVEIQNPDDPQTTTTLDDFAQAVVGDIENIQSQIDGNIETWFYDYMPVDLDAQDPRQPLIWIDSQHTIPCQPYYDWWYADQQSQTNNERIKHLSDIFYDNKTGYAFRFSNTGTAQSPVFSWVMIEDSAVIKALEDAARAQDTADHKRRVFATTQAHPTPYPPYDVGDLWVNADYTNPVTQEVMYTNDMLRCIASKPTKDSEGHIISNEFSINDWQLASKYTDDTALRVFINGAYADDLQAIGNQLDKKAETWYQDEDPEDTWYNTSLGVDEREHHISDLWYDTSENGGKKEYIYQKHVNPTTHEVTYYWAEIDVPDDVFDTIDGKAAIYVNNPTSAQDPYPTNYNEKDMWVLPIDGVNETYTIGGVVYNAGEILFASSDSSTFVASHWSRKLRYTGDERLDAFIQQILNGSGATGDDATVANAISVVTDSLKADATVIAGGLVLTSLIGMRDVSNRVWSGISGLYKEIETGTGYKGHGIAAWYGGGMADWEVYYDSLTQSQKENAVISNNYAKSLFRFDGSGYLAGGNITWDANGIVTIANVYANIGGTDTSLTGTLQTLTNLSNALPLTLRSGVTYLDPQYGFSQISITHDSNYVISNNSVLNYGEMKARFVPLEFFNALFTAYSDANHTNAINPWTWTDTAAASRAAINNLKILVGTWTEQYLSALGHNSQQGGGIGDVTWEALAGAGNQQINISHLSSAGVATQSWVRSQFGSSVVRVDVGTDQYFPTGGVVSLPAYPTTLPASDVSAWAKADTKPTYAFNEITGSLTEADIPSLSWSKITTGKPTSWWGVSSIDANGAVTGSMSNVGDIAFSASGKNIGGLLYFNTADSQNKQIKVGSNATLVQYAYSNGTFTPKLYVDGYAGVNGEVLAKGLELVGSGTTGNVHGGYIDFHYSESASDYTSRIIEKESGLIQLSTKIQTSRIYLYKPNANDTDAVYLECDTDHNVKLVGNFYATGAVSALGSNSQQGGTGVTLNQPLSAINSAGLSAPTVNGSVLVYSNNVWKYSSNAGIFATDINIAGTASASGFRATGKDNTYVLLGGGSTSKLKTINGNSIFGDGDIVISGGGDSSSYVKYAGNQTSIGQSSPFSGATAWAIADNIPNANALVYNNSGSEFSMLYSFYPVDLRYGTILRWGYADKYIRIARKQTGNWLSEDWEKISAGYSDTTGKLNTKVSIWGQQFDGSGDIGTNTSAKMQVVFFKKYDDDGTAGYVGRGANSHNGILLGSYVDSLELFANNGDYDLYINTSHNVGIGTNAPNSKLHVNGRIEGSGGLIVSGRAYNGGDDEGIVVKYDTSGYAALVLGSYNGRRSVFYINGGANGTTAPYWRYNSGSATFDILHPMKGGTIALTSDIPTSLPASDVYAWAKASTKPSYTLDEVGDGSTRKLSNYVLLAGDTMTGKLTVKAPIFGYNYNANGNNVAAFIFDKPGSNYTGIGAHKTDSVIWFGACDVNGAWVDTFKQTWDFNGTIKQEGNAVIHAGNIASQTVSSCTGNAGSATKLQNDRTIWGQTFNGTGNITGVLMGAGGAIDMQYTDEINRYGGTLYIQHRGGENSTAGQGTGGTTTGNLVMCCNGGKVGIGLPSGSLTDKLNVKGTIGVTGVSDGGFRITSSSANESYCFGASSTGYVWGSVNGRYLSFSNGRVQIHKSYFPENTAHYFRDPSATNWYGGMYWGSAGNEALCFVAKNANTKFMFVNNSDIADWANNTHQSVTPLMSIGANVGIGTQSPSTSLHVIGRVTCEYDSTKLGSFSNVRGEYLSNYGINSSGFTIITTGQSSSSSSTVRISMTPYNAPEQYILFGASSSIKMGTTISNNTETYRDGAYIQIGGARIVWDNTNKALKVIQSDNSTAANFYATGAISALGANTSSGGGGGNYVTIDGTQTITGAKTFNAAVLITQKLTVTAGVDVTGQIRSTNSSIACAHDITAGGNLSINGTATIGGQMTIGATVAVGSVSSQVIQTLNSRAIYIKTGTAPNFVDGTWSNTSDIRLKDIINNVGASVDQIANAPIFNYKWKSGGVSIMLGSSAQYWQNVFQYAVEIGPENYLYMDYSSVALASAVMVARKVQNHEDRILKLERENEQLRNEIKQLKAA